MIKTSAYFYWTMYPVFDEDLKLATNHQIIINIWVTDTQIKHHILTADDGLGKIIYTLHTTAVKTRGMGLLYGEK